jgi:hypothetical protein
MKYRILSVYKDGSDRFQVEKQKIPFLPFWKNFGIYSDITYAEHSIRSDIETIRKMKKSGKVVRKYNEADFLIDKLKGNAD